MYTHSINSFTDKKRIINLYICCKKRRWLFRAQTTTPSFVTFVFQNIYLYSVLRQGFITNLKLWS